MARLTTLAAGLAALVLGATAAQAQQTGTPEEMPCPLPLPWDGETEGETYSCGVVIVPENHDDPDVRTIELTYLRLNASTLSPAPDPVVYLSGGPGGSALHEISTNPPLHLNMDQLRERRDVIFFDQRGTGHSNLLACGPFGAAIGVVGELFGDRPGIDMDRLEALSAEGQGQTLMLAICAQAYAAADVDFAQYNSVASSRDIAALVTALGYDGGYNLYGTSYGTRLALNALRSTPDHIRAVVLDGTVSPAIPGTALTTAKVQEHYDTIFRLCAEDAWCAAEYPDLRNRFIAILADLAEEPLVFDPPLVPNDFARARFTIVPQIDPGFFATFALLNNGALQGGMASVLPAMIAAIEERDTETIRTLMGRGSQPEAVAVDELATADDVIDADDSYIAPSIDLILARAAADDEDSSLSGDWVDLVIGAFEQRLRAGEMQAEVIRDMVEFALLPVQGTDASALTGFADEHLAPDIAAEANALVGAMDRQTLRQTMWAIGDVAELMSGGSERSLGIGIAMGAMFAVNCSEDISLAPEEVAADYIAATPYPGVLVQDLDDYRQMRAVCSLYPTPFTEAEMLSPVVSDTPSLIFSQGLDTQTPVSFGRTTAETLANSFFLEWPSEGHVIAARSLDGCAGDIAAAFLDDPARQPSFDCAMTPRYSVPFQAQIERMLGAAE
ncbi:alpha/beta fold hydrolase [Rhodobacterales bacterium HKCCE3408]|nr:alpha/beta fold hydrolase [Rhodobacterales bacterium HKCCE3408]